MQHFVSQNTAIALREAGFPQPEPEFGQIFFSACYTGPFVYLRKGCGDILELKSLRGVETWEKSGSSDLLFAPTATDILKELGERYVLWYDNSPRVLKWYCVKVATTINQTIDPYMHEKPAEAAAAAWLAYNRNK